jgi:hypothetical protein
VATVAIKGTSSSSKSLFPKLNKGKNTCLMPKESKHKVKTKGLSSLVIMMMIAMMMLLFLMVYLKKLLSKS